MYVSENARQRSMTVATVGTTAASIYSRDNDTGVSTLDEESSSSIFIFNFNFIFVLVLVDARTSSRVLRDDIPNTQRILLPTSTPTSLPRRTPQRRKLNPPLLLSSHPSDTSDITTTLHTLSPSSTIRPTIRITQRTPTRTMQRGSSEPRPSSSSTSSSSPTHLLSPVSPLISRLRLQLSDNY